MDENSIRFVLQSFSSFMQLPVFLIQLNEGKIIASIEHETLAVTLLQTDLYRQLEEVALAIEQPAIVTSYDEKMWFGAKMAIAPLVTCEEQIILLVAGPYREENAEHKYDDTLPVAKSRSIIQQLTANSLLIKELTHYIRQHEEKLHGRLVSLLADVHSTTGQSFYRDVAERLVETKIVDFFGHAVKCSNGSFVVQFLVGEQINSDMSGKTFYVGEGLLGQVALQNTFLQWDEAALESRVSYFHQFGFYPSSVAVFPVEEQGELANILFAGFYRSKKLPSYMGWLFQRLNEQRRWAFKERERNVYQKMLQSLLDWTDRVSLLGKSSEMLEQLLDICCKMIDEGVCIYTNIAGQQKKRGTLPASFLQVHLQACMDTKARLDTVHTCFHLPINLEDEQGMLTVFFKESQFARMYMDVLQMMIRFLTCTCALPIENPSTIIEQVAGMEDVITDLPLTNREKEILTLVLEGMNNTEVSRQLNISSHTVKNHITNIFKKLNVTDRMQAMVKIHRIKNKDD